VQEEDRKGEKRKGESEEGKKSGGSMAENTIGSSERERMLRVCGVCRRTDGAR